MSPELFAMIFALVVFAGVFIVFMGLRQRSQHLEMQHRERMAMIERGIVPGPEDAFVHGGHRPGRAGYSTRSMSLGIIVVAIGLGLMTIISVAAEAPETGIGVGGAIAIVGAAFIVNSLVNRGHAAPAPRTDDRLQG